LFNQVLDNANGSTPKPPPSSDPVREPEIDEPAIEPETEAAAVPADPADAPPIAAADDEVPGDDIGNRDEGGFRRSLIRATFPRPEGQPPSQPRNIPEFTVQSLNNRRNSNQRHAGGANKFRGGRRRPGGGSQDHIGPMRFREHGHGQDRPQGQGHGGRRRRGGKKNR
jgi:hypothetical protein